MTQALHALLSDAGIAVPPGLVNPGLQAITTDSRRVGPGTLFLGLPGERVDGGSFWAHALEAGAAAAVIGAKAAAAQPTGGGEMRTAALPIRATHFPRASRSVPGIHRSPRLSNPPDQGSDWSVVQKDSCKGA